jgi:shikimate kinase
MMNTGLHTSKRQQESEKDDGRIALSSMINNRQFRQCTKQGVTVKEKSNIILIGMPGSGKSTVGIILAKTTSCNFIDTDILIQLRESRSLQNIVDSEGPMALRRVEEEVILSVNCRNHVIATGGSAAYSHTAMSHLKKRGIVVFLHATIDTLKSRIRDYDTRGLARRPDQSFEDLFHERLALYQQYADITILNNNLTQEDVCVEILKKLKSRV